MAGAGCRIVGLRFEETAYCAMSRENDVFSNECRP